MKIVDFISKLLLQYNWLRPWIFYFLLLWKSRLLLLFHIFKFSSWKVCSYYYAHTNWNKADKFIYLPVWYKKRQLSILNVALLNKIHHNQNIITAVFTLTGIIKKHQKRCFTRCVCFFLIPKFDYLVVGVIWSSKYFADCVLGIKASINNPIFSDAKWTSTREVRNPGNLDLLSSSPSCRSFF